MQVRQTGRDKGIGRGSGFTDPCFPIKSVQEETNGRIF